MTSARRFTWQRVGLVLTATLLAAFLAMPVLALLLTIDLHDFVAGLRHPLVWPALRLSLFTTAITLAVVVVLGTPLSWLLARSRSRVAHVVETLLQLPLVIPPAVAGVALLLAFGRRGILAGWLYPADHAVTFTTAAVVLAEVFVSAPFFVRATTSAFRRVDDSYLAVARSLGASPWRLLTSVALPLAMPAWIAAAAMSWARSLGEFGATLMFAGNLQGETQTLPLAIYTALEADMRVAQALSIVLVAVALSLLLVVQWLTPRPSSVVEVAS